MINETNVRCFLILAETLNFTETANRVYLTQQAVSKNISNLEDSFGFILFDRSGRNVRLTSEGEKCLEVFREMEKTYSRMINDLRAGFAQYSSSLHVGYQKYLELGSTLRGASFSLQRDFPNIQMDEVRHSPEELQRLLLQEELDLILLNSRFLQESPDCCTLELSSRPIVLLTSRDDTRIYEQTTWEDFRIEPLVVDRFEGESTRDFDLRIKRHIDAYGLNPSRTIVMPNWDSAYSAVVFGRGIMIASEFSRLIKDERLLALPTPFTDGLSCVWKKGVRKTSVLQYVEYLKHAFGLVKFKQSGHDLPGRK